MTNPHDHRAPATDLLSKRTARRYRTPQHTATTATTAPPLHQPPPGRRRGDRRTDAHSAHHLNPGNGHNPGNGRLPIAETDAPLRPPPAPLARVVTTRRPSQIEHELVLASGATAADLTTAMITISPAARLVGHRADVGKSLSLLFREPTEPPGGTAGPHVHTA